MKRAHLFISLTCCAAAATAHAQSSVTLYGIIDNGLFYTSNQGGSPAYQMQSGTLSASRFGLKGREDLGGGFATVFALENGFNVNSGKAGQSGRLFGRQSWVGIASPVGALTLGRQYDLATDFVGPFESGYAWSGGPGTQPGDHNNFNGSFRLNNALKFVSVDMSGLKIGATYSLGGVPGSPSSNSTWGIGVTYAAGPFAAAGTLSHINSPNTSVFDGTPTTVGANVSGLSFSGFASARTLQIAALGASVKFGGSTIGGTYSNTVFRNLGSGSGPNPEGYQGTAVLNSFELNYRYQFTPALTAGTAFIYTRVNSVGGAPGANYRQVNLGTDYLLSKRTDVYLFGYGQSASGTNSVGQAAVAQLAFTAASSSNRQLGIAAGLRHRF
ncbi:porin [Paraburkholderia sp.]|uniref:porin n=1 Tax=Paraburkholderia sp. TaxID=1926495 RepID=UPI0039E62ADF